MPVVIDLANPETDIEDLNDMVGRMIEDEVLEAMYYGFEYTFNISDELDDQYIKTLLEYDAENSIVKDVQTVDEIREKLELQREKIQSQNGEIIELYTNLVQIAEYIFIGENRKRALNAQKEGISRGWEMAVTIPVM